MRPVAVLQTAPSNNNHVELALLMRADAPGPAERTRS